MARKNILTGNPPYPVEQAIQRLGTNLRTARLRRNLTIEDVAARIGTGRHAVLAAEAGKPSTSVAVYAALLWTYDLLRPMEALADPATDETGLAGVSRRERARTDRSGALDSDF